MLMNELFALTGQGKTCTLEHLDMAQKNIIQVREGSYLMQLNILSSKQKRLLQAIAKRVVQKLSHRKHLSKSMH